MCCSSASAATELCRTANGSELPSVSQSLAGFGAGLPSTHTKVTPGERWTTMKLAERTQWLKAADVLDSSRFLAFLIDLLALWSIRQAWLLVASQLLLKTHATHAQANRFSRSPIRLPLCKDMFHEQKSRRAEQPAYLCSCAFPVARPRPGNV